MRQFHLPPCGVVSCADGAAFPGARRSVSPVNWITTVINCVVVLYSLTWAPRLKENSGTGGECTKSFTTKRQR